VRIVIKGPESHFWELGLDQVAQDSFDGDLVPWQFRAHKVSMKDPRCFASP
jgi:hypothetical protein